MKKIILALFIIHCSLLIASAQWVQQVSGVSTPLYNVDFVNRYTGWATGANSVILKTTNAGINWFQQNPNLSQSKTLYGLSMVNENFGFIAGNGETILKTTNGGFNWLIIRDGSFSQGNSFQGADFISESTGWLCGFGGIVFRTTNGGSNWDSINVGNTGPLVDIQFLNSQTGWVCGDVGNLRKSTDGGFTWFAPPLLTTANLTSLHFINILTGWTVSEQDNRVFKTTDGGTVWDTAAQIPAGMSQFLYCVYFSSAQTGWVGGSAMRLYKSTDGGFNWLQQVVPAPMFVSNFAFYNDSVGWAVGGSTILGAIINTTNGGTYVGISGNENQVPSEFKLFQNYPNPFNISTKFKIQIPKLSDVRIVINDILGREVRTVLDQKLNVGTYELELNAVDFSSGLYFYSMFADGKLVDIKKMILIK